MDKDTGTITMQHGLAPNRPGSLYHFSVEVYDRVEKKSVTATVAVVVTEVSEETVRKSRAVRLAGNTQLESARCI